MLKLRFLGAIKSNNNLEGYFIVDEGTGRSVPKTLRELKYLIEQGVTFSNAEYNPDTDSFVGTDGSLNRLPIFDRANCVFDRNTVTILGVLEKYELSYYKVMNEYGKIVIFREDELLGYLSVQNIVLTNAKLVMRDSKVIISAIKGTFPSMNITEFNKYVSSNKSKAGRVPEKVTQEPTKTRDTNNIDNVNRVKENNVLVKPDRKYFFGSIEWKSKLFIDRISECTSKAGNITIRRGSTCNSRANTLRKLTNDALSVEGSRSNTKKSAFATKDIKKLRNNTAYYYSRCITQRTILPILFGDIEHLCRILLSRAIADSWNEYLSKVRQKEMVIQKKRNKNHDLFVSLCKNDYALLKEYYSKMQKGEYVPRDIYFSCKILFEGYKTNIVPDCICSNTSKLTNEQCFNLYWKYKIEQYDGMSRVNKSCLVPVRGYSKLALTQTAGLIVRNEIFDGRRSKVLVCNKALELDMDLYAETISHILNFSELKEFISKLKEYVYTGANAFITQAIKGYYKEDKARELLSNFSKFYDKIPQDMETRKDEAKAVSEYKNYFVLACIIKDKKLSSNNGEEYSWIKRGMKGNIFNVTLPELQEIMSAKNIVF